MLVEDAMEVLPHDHEEATAGDAWQLTAALKLGTSRHMRTSSLERSLGRLRGSCARARIARVGRRAAGMHEGGV